MGGAQPRVTPIRMWLPIVVGAVFVVIWAAYDFAVLQTVLLYLLAAYLVVISISIFARFMLPENVEDEFKNGPITMRRKLFVLAYECAGLVASIVLLAGTMTAATYAVMRHLGYNPFNEVGGITQLFLFFLDQAVKGGLSDIVDVFGVGVPTQLHLDASKHYIFGAIVLAFRWASSLLLFGGLTLLVYGLFLKRRKYA